MLLCAPALVSAVAHAQPLATHKAQPNTADAAESPATKAQAVAQDSPRASLASFLELCRQGNYDAAARYLWLDPSQAGRGAELARRLKAVLDRHLWFDLSDISPDSAGDITDGLPAGVDELGSISVRGSVTQPVRMIRRETDTGASWVFSQATVSRIDAWYTKLQDRWIIDHLPEPLLRPGPRELLWWQWLALPLLALLSWALGFVFGRLTRALLTPLVKRTSAHWDDDILLRIGAPLTLAWMLAVAAMLLPWLGLYQPAEQFMLQLLRVLALATFFWALARCVDMAVSVTASSSWGSAHPASGALLSLTGRIAKVGILAVAAIALLSALGYPVASLLAGLGIGGLALALAAQKTVENLFGAFSITVDQPFRTGDFVRIEDFVGTVELIGLRSTRVRTLDRTLVSIPNGKLADMRLESFAARDRIRLACTLGVEYGTTAAQMRQIIAGFERVLREHPKIWPDAVIVFFTAFADSSLNIDVMAWFQTSDWNEFQAIRQEVLLSFMHVVEEAGSSFAFPTRTLHLVSDAQAPA